MNDLEVCKRIAEIELKDSDRHGWDYSECGTFIVIGDGEAFNPLTDKALAFDLMVKYGISSGPNSVGWSATINYDDGSTFGPIMAYCPQRAICLAIIEKHKNDKQ